MSVAPESPHASSCHPYANYARIKGLKLRSKQHKWQKQKLELTVSAGLADKY